MMNINLKSNNISSHEIYISHLFSLLHNDNDILNSRNNSYANKELNQLNSNPKHTNTKKHRNNKNNQIIENSENNSDESDSDIDYELKDNDHHHNNEALYLDPSTGEYVTLTEYEFAYNTAKEIAEINLELHRLTEQLRGLVPAIARMIGSNIGPTLATM